MRPGTVARRDIAPSVLLRAGVVALASVVACQAVLGIEDTTDAQDGAVLPVDGGTVLAADAAVLVPASPSDDGGDVVDEAPPEVLAPIDSGAGDGGESTPSAMDASCVPTSTFIPQTGATGTVCNSELVLPDRSGAAGLDFVNNVQKLGVADGRNVTACIGVRFAKPLTSFYVRAATQEQACDRDCIGSFCGTGTTAAVFIAPNNRHKYLKTLTLGTAWADYLVNVPAGDVTTVAFVCRTGWSGERNDVGVYGIWGTCVP